MSESLNALNKIVGSLSNWNYHNLLKEIEIVKQTIEKNDANAMQSWTGFNEWKKQHDAKIVSYWQHVATQEWHKGFAAAVEAAKENQFRHDTELRAKWESEYRSKLRDSWRVQHYAEMQKPLIDALERISKDENNWQQRLADSALAKIKEEK